MRDGAQRPLPFFPQCVEAIRKAQEQGKPVTMGTVLKPWSKEAFDNGPAGDHADRFIALCFGGDDFPAHEFDTLVALTRVLYPDGLAVDFPMVS
jgi:hypothetical protein